jgi:hypothetical protein
VDKRKKILTNLDLTSQDNLNKFSDYALGEVNEKLNNKELQGDLSDADSQLYKGGKIPQ